MSASRRCVWCIVVIEVIVAAVVVAYVLTKLLEPGDGQNLPPSANPTNGSRASHTLKFLAVVSRHGSRGPLSTFPNNPYPVNETRYWPYGMGNLTPYGRVQMYNLGVKIRSLYNGFLKAEYYGRELYATSTALARTLASGATFLAGLYPPTGFQLWNNEIFWQPIPLFSDSLDKSLVVTSCPRYVQATTEAMAEYSSNEAISEINAYLSRHAGWNLSTAEDFLSVWDPIICAVTEGYALPEWTKEVYPDPMTDIAAKSLLVYYAPTLETTRLLIGTFFDQMIEVMKSKISGTLIADHQMHYYSAHDVSLMALQVVLGIDRSFISLVRPASALIYELHQHPDTEEYSVQVLYIDGSSHTLDPVALSIPGCDASCDFNLLVNITQKYCNVNYEEECKLNQTLSHNT